MTERSQAEDSGVVLSESPRDAFAYWLIGVVLLALGAWLGETRRSPMELGLIVLLNPILGMVLRDNRERSRVGRSISRLLAVFAVGAIFAYDVEILDPEHSRGWPMLLCFAGVTGVLIAGLLDPGGDSAAPPPPPDRSPCESSPPLPEFREPGGPGLFDDAQQR